MEAIPTQSRKMKTRINVELYGRILETFNREGLEGVMPFFADDIEVYDPDMPQGSYRGRHAVRRMIQLLTSGFSKVEVRASRLVPAGDRVVALLHTRATGE